MKKYKLIKKYPNSSALGTIVEKFQTGSDGHVAYKTVSGIERVFPIDWVEGFSEFWQEVEKDLYFGSYVAKFLTHGEVEMWSKEDSYVFSLDEIKDFLLNPFNKKIGYLNIKFLEFDVGSTISYKFYHKNANSLVKDFFIKLNPTIEIKCQTGTYCQIHEIYQRALSKIQ